MSMIDFGIFFKRYGVRVPQNLMAPVMPTIDRFSFPKNSIYHFTDSDGVADGPASDDYYIRDIKKLILVDHVLKLTGSLGQPRLVTPNLLPYVQQFHMKNRVFRKVFDAAEKTSDQTSLIIVNYAMINTAYRYIKSLYTEYHKWWNVQKTVFDKVKTTAIESNRNQFVFCKLPQTLSSISVMDRSAATETIDQLYIRKNQGAEALMLVELWKWLNPEQRARSILPDLDNEALRKINLVFVESGRFIVVNLGVLDSWGYDKLNPKINPSTGEKVKQDIKIEWVDLRKRVLRMFMTHIANRSLVRDDPIESNEESEPEPGEDSDDQNESTRNKDSVLSARDNADLDADIKDNPYLPDPDTLDIELDESKTTYVQNMLASLDDDLKELEAIEAKRQIEIEENKQDTPSGVDKQKVFTDKTIDIKAFDIVKTPEEKLMEICDKLADDGLISANAYKSFSKQAANYKNIKTAFDINLGELSTITPDELTIHESATIPDIPTVTDKTMLRSSLLEFDERYVTEILQKDLARMIVNTQKAGFSITNYSVETSDDIMGKYDAYSVRVSPIEGVPSTLRFKLPRVEADGIYQVNGTRYRLRKQRGDLPIRKIGPDRVSLSSFYGKTTVSRNDKRVNDYGHWLNAKIMQAGLDPENTFVDNLSPANVFDSEFMAPRTYSIIASSFKSFIGGGFSMVFDHTERKNMFPAEILETYEKDGSILFGFNNKNEYLVIDKNNTIYVIVNGVLTPRDSIENILGIDASNAPIDYAQIKIYGKNIPIGVILGYQYGLDKLMELLKVSPRRVGSGQRQNLQDNEFAIPFSDETLIFSKDDRLATLILAGFSEFTKTTKNYSVYTFDKPGVYFNILDANGIGVRYLREIDLMDDLFVDPITEDLLKEMNEPTTFKGLMVRASEMLLVDTHSHPLNMEEMRIKGYERFSGAVYAEMINSIREHKSRSGRHHQPIELHPFAVWKRIDLDPAKQAVSEINPIQNLKEMEAVTYSGTGGRMSRSMTKKSREYHPNDLGVISEATTDSSDVAINTFLSADPQFKSLRGTTKPYVIGKTGATALLSTSALISPSSDKDD